MQIIGISPILHHSTKHKATSPIYGKSIGSASRRDVTFDDGLEPLIRHYKGKGHKTNFNPRDPYINSEYASKHLQVL